eukprot:138041_1
MESCTDDKVLFIEAPSLEFLHKKPEWSFKNNVLRRIGLHDLRHVFTLFLILGITMYITYRFELSRMKKGANSESENQPRTGVKLESENEPHISRAKLESENEPRITGAKFESENKPRTDAANVTVVDNKIEQQNNIDDSANSESEDESRTGAKFESENGPRTVIQKIRGSSRVYDHILLKRKNIPLAKKIHHSILDGQNRIASTMLITQTGSMATMGTTRAKGSNTTNRVKGSTTTSRAIMTQKGAITTNRAT